MSISRRNFIKIGSISAALVAGNCLGLENPVFGQSILSGGMNLPPEIYADPLFSFHAESFSKLVGSPFSLFAEDFAETAVLAEVRENAFASRRSLLTGTRIKRKIESPAENFMLSFRITSAGAKQATYTVIHKNLGQFDLLLVPAQNEKGELLLNAVINRL